MTTLLLIVLIAVLTLFGTPLFVIISGIGPIFGATIGISAASASINTIPNPSPKIDVNKKRSNA